jgi:magnesium chelatase family protein
MLEVTKIYSVAGLLPRDKGLITTRPFRAPHHTISNAGLIGGGSIPKPGEVSLAHNGVLFLDEFPEFHRDTLEVLRQPLEDGEVTITRAAHTITFPARFTLVAAMNPCPCGYATDMTRRCTCTESQIRRYRMRISGPLVDRIDIHIEVPKLRPDEILEPSQSETSAQIRERVMRARQIQLERFAGSGIFCNAHMQQKHMRQFCIMTEGAKQILRRAIESLGFSARGSDRILKVARTIADLCGSELIREEHIAEAIQYRALDRELFV